ncbi:MAG: FecR family protein [Niastella sp.]|uniref:FecR family protein n=1 Tax=Niastella sp. TaxID=1869183 RepID=UPI003899EBC0
MSKQRLTWLLEQHLANKTTEQERQELYELVKANDNDELFKQVLSEKMQTETPGVPVDAAPWQKMIQDIVGIDKAPALPVKRSANVFTLYRWVAAAAVLVLIGTGTYFLMTRTTKPALTVTKSTLPALPVTPVNKNSLLLADGSHIWLDEVNNGKIATLEGTTITKKDSQIIYTTTSNSRETYYNVVSTARSGQYEVVLPDGSHVWLNAASAIRFPASFTGKERSVELLGEAWFDVQHADKIPFIIHSGNMVTSVMGTAFDIKAYPGERSMIVAVQRGKVKVQSGNQLLATLEKGRQVKVTTNTSPIQSNIDPAIIAGWRKGDLYYKDERLADITADLQRVFNASIQIKKASLKEEITTVSFNKNTGLAKALAIICRITDARFSVNNGIYIIE